MRTMFKRRISPRAQIQKTQHIAELEEGWSKNPRQPMISISVARTRNTADVELDKLKKYKMFIHSHPEKPSGKATPNPALPSWEDVLEYARILNENGKTRTAVIACVNQKGKLTGYTFFRSANARSETIETMDRTARSTMTDRMANTVLGKISELESVGLRLRFVPVKGYTFDRLFGKYVKKRLF